MPVFYDHPQGTDRIGRRQLYRHARTAGTGHDRRGGGDHNEPGCAVREALENGTLSAERWKTFSRLEKENQWSKIRKNEKMMTIAMERRKRNMTLQRHGRGTVR